jgi:hypothetical protein
VTVWLTSLWLAIRRLLGMDPPLKPPPEFAKPIPAHRIPDLPRARRRQIARDVAKATQGRLK